MANISPLIENRPAAGRVERLHGTYAWYGHLKNLATSRFVWAGLCMVGAVYFIFRS
jgi:uncharacterized protein (DUF486 family)